MLNLYRELDQAKVELPRFVAADLARLPTVKPGEVDMYYMAVTVAKLTQQLERVSARLEALEKQKLPGPPPGPPSQAAPTGSSASETPPGLPDQSASNSSSIPPGQHIDRKASQSVGSRISYQAMRGPRGVDKEI